MISTALHIIVELLIKAVNAALDRRRHDAQARADDDDAPVDVSEVRVAGPRLASSPHAQSVSGSQGELVWVTFRTATNFT